MKKAGLRFLLMFPRYKFVRNKVPSGKTPGGIFLPRPAHSKFAENYFYGIINKSKIESFMKNSA